MKEMVCFRKLSKKKASQLIQKLADTKKPLRTLRTRNLHGLTWLLAFFPAFWFIGKLSAFPNERGILF